MGRAATELVQAVRGPVECLDHSAPANPLIYQSVSQMVQVAKVVQVESELVTLIANAAVGRRKILSWKNTWTTGTAWASRCFICVFRKHAPGPSPNHLDQVHMAAASERLVLKNKGCCGVAD